MLPINPSRRHTHPSPIRSERRSCRAQESSRSELLPENKPDCVVFYVWSLIRPDATVA